MKNTDIEKLKKLFDSFDVEYVEGSYNGEKYIDCKEGNRNIEGYTGFYTCFDFDMGGNFISIGAFK